MIGILLSLLPLIFWGTADYVGSKSTKEVSPFALSLFYSFTGFVVTIPLAVIFGLPEFTTVSVVNFLLSAVFINIGFLMLLRGFKYGPAGIVAPIANAYAIVTTIFAIFFLHENIAGITLAGIIVVVAGIATVSYTKPKEGEFKDMKKALTSSVMALLFFGIGFVFFDKAAIQSWSQNLILYDLTSLIAASAIYLVAQKKDKISQIKKCTKNAWYYLGGVGSTIGLLGMFAALEITGSIAITVAIAAAAPLFTAFLAYALDKEKLTHLQRFATVIIVVGIILLSI